MVSAVRNIDVPMHIDRHTLGRVEFSNAAPAPFLNEGAFGQELLYAMVTGVGDVDESFTIQCNRFRMIQLTIIIPLLTPRDKMNAGGNITDAAISVSSLHRPAGFSSQRATRAEIDLGAIESVHLLDPVAPIQTDRRISIYPNPMMDQIRIRTTDGRNIHTLEIIDITGRTVRTYNKIYQNEKIITKGKLRQGS